MSHFYNVFIYSFASLFSILNPIGMSAVFLSITKNHSTHERHTMAYKVAFYSAILLTSALFIGPYVLRFFDISLSCIQIAGGMLVFYTAWNMLDIKTNVQSKKSNYEQNTDITFFPLTMPITAGAGSLAVVIALTSQFLKPGPFSFELIDYLSIISAIIIVFIMVGLCYRYADTLFNKLGTAGTNVITSLTAFILLAISINIMWEGILGLIMPVVKQSIA